jgi:predicted transcriptional regulator
MDKSTIGNIYGTTEDRINTMMYTEDSKAIHRVFKAMAQEFPVFSDREPTKMIDHFIDMYGLKLTYIDDGHGITAVTGWDASYTIVDEAKYTFFLLKYMK